MDMPLRVLLLEDNLSDASLIEYQLQRDGFSPEIVRVETREEYLTALALDPDIILADYNLPQFDAIRALRLQNQAGKDIPFLIVSGTIGEDLAVLAIKEGAADYLLKDRLARLGEAVSHALHEQRLHAAKKQAERALRASETLNRAVLDSLCAHIAVLDKNGTIIAINGAWEQFACSNGLVSAEPVGLGVSYLEVCCKATGAYSEEAPLVLQGLHGVLEGCLSHFQLEYPCHAPQQERWFLLSATPLSWQQGGAVVSHIDITERKLAERAQATAHREAVQARLQIEEMNIHLRQAVEHSRELMVSLEKENTTKTVLLASISSILIGLDADLKITLWNAAAENAFGISASAALDQPFLHCAIEWDWDCIRKQLDLCRERKQAMRLNDLRYTRPGGRQGVMGITVTPFDIVISAETGFLLLGADITERKTLETHLAHAQKMESIGQLAAGIAHEINTPTQYIGDNVRFLKEAYDDLGQLLLSYEQLLNASRQQAGLRDVVAQVEKAIQDYDVEYLRAEIPTAIEQSLDGIRRVSGIVQAMKEFSHPGTEEKQAIDINRAIESTLTVARNEWKYVAEVVTNFDATLPLVPCLPGDFNQVILNLLVNAAHAIAEAAPQKQTERGVIQVSTHRDGDWAEIRIADTGTGIPEAIRSRIFDPFFTTKPVGKGTGQGLPIAHSIVVDKHRGTIGFESETGKGTTFIIRLPLAPEAIERALAA